jgi:EAL domain-containing protein (putative c-di-GMP-specific phosphodiesterase class I)
MNSALTAAGAVAGDLASVLSRMRTESGHSSGTFADLTIGSHFQPIYSLAHSRTVGFEALMRATNSLRQPVSPLAAFESMPDSAARMTLDRLARAVHVGNFLGRGAPEGWLFLNVSTEVLLESGGEFFRSLLDAFDFPRHRVVIEVLEQGLGDSIRLVEAVQFYRSLGFVIALDDFGAGHSNFDRIWTLQPDIVKLDRSMIAQAGSNPRIRRMMPAMVSLLHEAGSLVLMEGIETVGEALMAMDADADFVQGYYFARPAPELPAADQGQPLLDALWRDFRDISLPETHSQRNEIAPYRNAIGYAASLLESGLPLERAAAGFLELPGVERSFVLDREGRQLGDNLVGERYARVADRRFAPLHNARGANWSRRYYFRRALEHPGRVQVTRPYLSVAAANQCVTVSIAVLVNGDLRVLCGDIAWRERGPAGLKDGDRTADKKQGPKEA